MHLKRWITAIVAVPLIFFLVFSGPPLFLTLILTVAALIALWEFFKIAFKGQEQLIPYFAPPAYLAAIGIFAGIHFARFDLILMFLCFDLILLGLISMPLFKTHPSFPDLITKQIFSLVYIPVFLSFIILLRQDPEAGRGWVFFVLCLVAGGDVGAYYVGSYWGKHKLCPAVSPKKTIEGSMGGLCTNIVVGLVFAAFFIPTLPWQLAIFISVLVGLTGQLGDLFESEFKRAAGVKDSGTLLPGHGGMLDRIDALLFASPVAYLLKEVIF